MLNRQTSSVLLKSLLFFFFFLFFFFTAIIPSAKWPAQVVASSDYRQHTSSGVEHYFSEPDGRYTFYMILPLIMIVLIGICSLAKHCTHGAHDA